MKIYETSALVAGQDVRKLGSFTEEEEARAAVAWIIDAAGMTAEGGWEESPDFQGIVSLTCHARATPRFSPRWVGVGRDGKQGKVAVLDDCQSREGARAACEAHARAALTWHPVPSHPDTEGAGVTLPGGSIRRYAVKDLGARAVFVVFAIKTVGVSAADVRAYAEKNRLPVPQSRAPAPNVRPRREQLYIVQSGRSSVLHLMLSKTPSTPNPNVTRQRCRGIVARVREDWEDDLVWPPGDTAC